MPHQVAPEAEDDLDAIWLYVARESGSMDVANRLIDSITDRFVLLAGFPYAGRIREVEFGTGVRTFPVGEYIIVYSVDNSIVAILRVVHGRRDLAALFNP